MNHFIYVKSYAMCSNSIPHSVDLFSVQAEIFSKKGRMSGLGDVRWMILLSARSFSLYCSEMPFIVCVLFSSASETAQNKPFVVSVTGS